jgi:uncharacterized protein (UPF0332 family)
MTSNIFLKRAQNELLLSQIIFDISSDKNLKQELFSLPSFTTFYSAVITHSYYAIFYSAKAYLSYKGIITKPPFEHKKTFEELSILADKGIIDFELFKAYKKVLIKANELLDLFTLEKQKRGKFTYKTLPQANKDPANESIKNAHTFFKHINILLST